MTRFVVDSTAVLYLAAAGLQAQAAHRLLAPTLLRSQALSSLHEALLRGEISARDARERLAHIRRIPIRLLGDAVLQRRAWELATQLGWPSSFNAEYVALTQLQADALVTLDIELARKVAGVVTVAPVEALYTEEPEA